LILKPKPSRADIVVIGGGLSGIAAAISASREGATVSLVERLDELGGSIGENIQMPIDTTCTSNNVFFRESGLFEEIIFAIRSYNNEGTHAGQARALLTFLKSEPNITPYLGYHCLTAFLNRAKDRIESCSAVSQREGNEVLFRAQYFVDATGCGQLSKLAGVPGESGVNLMSDSARPNKAISRSAALIEIDSAADPTHFRCPEWVKIKWEENSLVARTAWMESLKHRFCGFHHLEWVAEDPTTPNTSELCWAAWDYLKNRSPLGKASERLFIKRIIALSAKENTFRGLGDYILTKEDLLSGNVYPDSVAVGRSPLCENHSLIYSPKDKFALPQAFEIPLRCLYSQKVKNLLWVSGHASCDSIVSSNLSHPPTAAQMGSAVGFCAAHCIIKKRLPRTLAKEGHIEKMRSELNQRNHRTCLLPITNDSNLSLRASVNASTTWNPNNLDQLPKKDGLETNTCLIQFPLVTNHLDTIRLLLSCRDVQTFDVRLLSGSPQNGNIPGTCLEVDSVEVRMAGKQWVEFSFKTQIPSKGWYYLEIHSAKNFRLIEARNAPVGQLVQYPHELSQANGENQYCDYSPISDFHPTPHHCAVLDILPIQKVYQPNEVITSSSRPFNKPNLWISQPTNFSYPEFIELNWSNQITPERIDIYFDPCFGYHTPPHPKPINCGPANSLIKDYNIYITGPNGKSDCLIEIRNNQNSYRSHSCEDRHVTSLALEILSTHGLDRAQVFQIALY